MNRNSTMSFHNDSHKICWFCKNEHAKPYQIELTKYERRLGEIGGGRKYTRNVKIYMCNKCCKALNNQQRFKGIVYFLILLGVITAVCIYFYHEPSMSDTSPFKRILYGFICGFCIGIFPAHGITKLIPNSPQGKNKLRKSLGNHPDIIAANLDGFSLD